MKAAGDTSVPTLCRECGADQFGCQVKSGLSGRRCCGQCTHDDGQEPARAAS